MDMLPLLGVRAMNCLTNTYHCEVLKVMSYAKWVKYKEDNPITLSNFMEIMHDQTDGQLGRIPNCGKITVRNMRKTYEGLLRKRTLCAAAIMGHTNMGQPAPTKDKVQDWMRMDTDRWPWNLNDYVEAVSGHLFESYEHQEIFLGEAESWLKTCAEEPFLSRWPEKAELFV